MAAFIVISSNNRLHYLVDGITACRPLNQGIPVGISTGKIKTSDEGCVYEYEIYGEGIKSGDVAMSFSDLLANQLAAFRLAHTIGQGELVNIFFLENPMTEEELAESELWIKEFDKVYHSGHGHDTDFCLFRVIFTYNHDNPSDVRSQIEPSILKRLLADHRNAVESEDSTFQSYLFYIDNQKNDAAALCLTKEEHDLKMSRFLMDFMMLVSSNSDKYNVLSAINPPDVNTRCFAVGFAESMYYYPDVERYYIHADVRDINRQFLVSDDEQQDCDGKAAMDIDKYPFGLRARKERLGKIYEDVPFTENIGQYPDSADKKIDDCIVALRELIEKERAKELDDFMHTAKAVKLKDDIAQYEMQIADAVQNEDETLEEFTARLNHLAADKESAEQELDKLVQSFEPNAPAYIDRSEIYNELCVADDESKDASIYSAHYNRLINFIKSKKFYDFVKTDSASTTADEEDINVESLENNSGCILSWLFGKRNKRKDNSEMPNPNVVATETCVKLVANNITNIKELLDLKATFSHFKDKVATVEQAYKDEKRYCDAFTLTTHNNHYFHLIDLQKLKNTQSATFEERVDKVKKCWREEDAPTKSGLVYAVRRDAAVYAHNNYLFINWERTFPFVAEVSENLSDICNELQKRAAPIVNYNLTSELKDNNISRYLLSDRPDFEAEIERIKGQLHNGNEMAVMKSEHIASKISMLQFLPMDDAVLDNLVDLQEQDEAAGDTVVGVAKHK